MFSWKYKCFFSLLEAVCIVNEHWPRSSFTDFLFSFVLLLRAWDAWLLGSKVHVCTGCVGCSRPLKGVLSKPSVSSASIHPQGQAVGFIYQACCGSLWMDAGTSGEETLMNPLHTFSNVFNADVWIWQGFPLAADHADHHQQRCVLSALSRHLADGQGWE